MKRKLTTSPSTERMRKREKHDINQWRKTNGRVADTRERQE